MLSPGGQAVVRLLSCVEQPETVCKRFATSLPTPRKRRLCDNTFEKTCFPFFFSEVENRRSEIIITWGLVVRQRHWNVSISRFYSLFGQIFISRSSVRKFQ